MEKPAKTNTMRAAKRSSLEIRLAPLPISMAHGSPDGAASWRRSVKREEGLSGPQSSWHESRHRRQAPTRKR